MLKKKLLGIVVSAMMILSLSDCGKSADTTETIKDDIESSTSIGISESEEENTGDADIDSDIDANSEVSEMNYRTEPNTPEELAYVAYEEYLKDGPYGEITSYEFVYIDDDDIPELVMNCQGVLALSYHDGEVVPLCYSSAYFFDYVERQGYFRYGGMYREDRYTKLSDGSLEVVAHYEPILNGAEYSGENTYYIGNMDNGKEVSKDEYDSYISSLGNFSSLMDEGIKYSSMYDAYKALKGISDEITFSEDEVWKEAYYNSHEFYDDEYTGYYIVDPNKDGIPEVIMEDVDGGREVFYLDKFNKLNSMGYGYPVYEGETGSIYIVSGAFQQVDDRTITEYKYFEESGSWSASNQFEIIIDDDWSTRLPEDYDNSEGQLYKDSEYCSYKVNGKDYSSYDEAVNAFSAEYASGDVQEVNAYEDNYKSYNYKNFRQAILDYGLEVYEPLMYQVTRFEFKDGKLSVTADTAPKLEDDSLQSVDISYPIALDCKWYNMFEGDVEGLTTYDYICKCQQELRSSYDNYDVETADESVVFPPVEAASFLGIKVKDGVIVEIYLDYLL